MPSRWSISCWRQRASKPSASIARIVPSGSDASTSTSVARFTFAVRSGMLRQPSRAISLPDGKPYHGVDQHQQTVMPRGTRMLADVDNHHPHLFPELGRSESDTSLIGAHRVDEVRGDTAGQLGVGGMERPRSPLEHGMRIAQDLPNGQRTSCSRGRIVRSTPCCSRTSRSDCSNASSDRPAGSATSIIMA